MRKSLAIAAAAGVLAVVGLAAPAQAHPHHGRAGHAHVVVIAPTTAPVAQPVCGSATDPQPCTAAPLPCDSATTCPAPPPPAPTVCGSATEPQPCTATP